MPEIEMIDAHLLTPDSITVYKGDFNMLQVEVKGKQTYKGVFAVQAFPISNPNKFVSLFHYDEHDKTREIGMIEDVSRFPGDTQAIINEALGKHYYAYDILRINDIKWEFGLLHFDVETNKGPRKFSMRWEQHRAIDFGERGKIIMDIFDDRYIIPDVEALHHLERDAFTRYVFW